MVLGYPSVPQGREFPKFQETLTLTRKETGMLNIHGEKCLKNARHEIRVHFDPEIYCNSDFRWAAIHVCDYHYVESDK